MNPKRVVRLPGVAPGHTPWHGAILLLNHNRENYEGRELRQPWWPSARTSRPMPFQQRTNTSCYLAIPTHGFTVVLSVFEGTPPAKPLNCKSVSNGLGARNRPAWTHHVGGTPRHSCASIRLARSDIIKTSRCYRSQIVAFRCCHFTVSFREQKTLLTLR